MTGFLPTTGNFAASAPVDLRRVFDGLATLVRNSLGHDPLDGSLYVFSNRRRDRIKILFWEPGGYWLCTQRLEQGTFRWPKRDEPSARYSREELTLLLGGIDLAQIRRRKKVQKLDHQLKLLKRCLFESRSEKISAEDLEARIQEHAQEAAWAVAGSRRPDEAPAEAEEEKPEPKTQKDKDRKQRKARPRGRNPLPEHLTRIRIEHPIDPAQSTCPHCPDHPPLVQIGEDVREKLHKLPVQYVKHQHVYPKYFCQRCHDGVVRPEGHDNSLKADITVVADVVVQKYPEHKPLYRQQQAFDRVGIPLRRQTQCDWTGWCSDQVAPVVQAVREYILQQQCVQYDETAGPDATGRRNDASGAKRVPAGHGESGRVAEAVRRDGTTQDSIRSSDEVRQRPMASDDAVPRGAGG